MGQPSKARDAAVILVVEDNPVNRLLLGKKIEQAGFSPPLWAANGRDAIAVALESDPDLILMDIQLPDLNGNEVIRRLRMQNYGGPIVAVSADGAPEDMDRSFAAGANGFIAKPIDFAVFASRIDEFLAAAAGRETRRESAPKGKLKMAAASRSNAAPSVSAAAMSVWIVDAKEKLQILADALGHGDDEDQLARIRAIAHEYKGNAGYFGLRELEGIACELDAAFRDDERPEQLMKLTGRLAAEIEGILHENA
jgi:CheY-like chemotaxis protein